MKMACRRIASRCVLQGLFWARMAAGLGDEVCLMLHCLYYAMHSMEEEEDTPQLLVSSLKCARIE